MIMVREEKRPCTLGRPLSYKLPHVISAGKEVGELQGQLSDPMPLPLRLYTLLRKLHVGVVFDSSGELFNGRLSDDAYLAAAHEGESIELQGSQMDRIYHHGAKVIRCGLAVVGDVSFRHGSPFLS